MKVLILSMGTRGDVEPYIGLAQALRRENVAVSFASSDIHKSHIEKYGIHFISIGGEEEKNTVADLAENRGLQAVKRGLSLMFDGMREAHPIIDGIVPEFDIVIGHGWIGELEADMHGKLFIRAGTSPNLAAPDPHSGFMKKFQKGIGTIFLKKLILKPYNEFRTRLGGGPISIDDIYSKPFFLPIPTVLTQGEAFAPSVFQSDYWFPDNGAFSLPEKIERFLRKKGRKLLVTFGSMTSAHADLPALASLFITAGGKFGFDVVWIGTEVRSPYIDAAEKDGGFIQAEECPHQFLLPKVDAAVHHCGLGTTCSVLRAGVPSIPVPHLVDQFDWAKRLYRMGIAAKPVAVKDINEKTIGNRLETALKSELYSKELNTVKEKMNEQARVEEAVRRIMDIYAAKREK